MKKLLLLLLPFALLLCGPARADAFGGTAPGCPYINGAKCSIPTWAAALNVQVNTEVYGSDGNIYQSQVANNVANPASATECGTNWKPVSIFANKTLNVNAAGSAQCSTIPAAMTFLSGATISETAIVTIHLADGTYTMGTTPISLNHPFGRQIKIIGNTGTPANVTMNYSGFTTTAATVRGLFEIMNGATSSVPGIAQINGIAFVGPSNSVCTPSCGSASSGYPGSIFVLAIGAGINVTVGPNVTMTNGYSGVAAFFGANIIADNTTCSGGADGCYWAYGNGSVVSMIGACAQDAATPTIFAGAGALADNKGYIIMDGAHVGGNATALSLFNDGGARTSGPGGGVFFGRDCSNNVHTDGVAVKTNDTDPYNLEGTPAANSDSVIRHTWTNYIEGGTLDDITGSIIRAFVGNGNYTQVDIMNNTNDILFGVNKNGNAILGSITSPAGFITSIPSMPFYIGAGNRPVLRANVDRSFSQIGVSSGVITFAEQAAAGTYNWNWPTTAGTTGYFLTSDGGGAGGGMTWTPPPASVLSGTTSSIGGGALLAGACASGTVAVTSSTTAMAVVATPVTYPGDGAYWMGYVSTNGTVTVKVCATIALTPSASAYNVRVVQ